MNKIKNCLLSFVPNVRRAFQRLSRGYDDTVVWSIDWYLAKNIPLWVRELRDISIGVPNEMFDGMDPIDDNYEYSEEDWEIATQKWHQILEDIAVGFESYMEREDCVLDKERRKELDDKYQHGFDLFRKYFENL